MHIIPETLRVTTIGNKGVGSMVNIEIDARTQAIVETMMREEGASMNLGIVCGSFHREEVEEMLEFAKDEAASKNWRLWTCHGFPDQWKHR